MFATPSLDVYIPHVNLVRTSQPPICLSWPLIRFCLWGPNQIVHNCSCIFFVFLNPHTHKALLNSCFFFTLIFHIPLFCYAWNLHLQTRVTERARHEHRVYSSKKRDHIFLPSACSNDSKSKSKRRNVVLGVGTGRRPPPPPPSPPTLPFAITCI